MASFSNVACTIFSPSCRIQALGNTNSNPPAFTVNPRPDGKLEVQWGGLEYAVDYDGRSLSEDQVRLVAAVSNGSRTTAALESSKFGSVLKISEDGLVSFYKDRQRVWEI